MRKRWIALAALVGLLGSFQPVRRTAEAAPISEWAKQDIQEARLSDLIPPGMGSSLGEALTREEFCEMAVMLYSSLTGEEPGRPRGKSPFRDTANVRVLQAYELGIVKGEGGRLFLPKKSLTREQLAVMLYNALLRAGVALNTPAGAGPAKGAQAGAASGAEPADGARAASGARVADGAGAAGGAKPTDGAGAAGGAKLADGAGAASGAKPTDGAGAAGGALASAPPVFADAAQIASWSKEAIRSLAAAGFMKGSPDAAGAMRFFPRSRVTGVEAVVLVNRIFKQYGVRYVDNDDELISAVAATADSSAPKLPVVIRNDRLLQANNKAETIVGQIIQPGMTDYEKELAIHDYLLLHTAYDYDDYVNGTVPDDSYTMYGALVNGVAVCQGYAYAAQLMLELAGIESHIVTGTADGIAHAWNKVRIGGEYYNLDVTWDDPVPDVEGRIAYGYFNVTDAELRRDHVWRDELPAADATAANYFVYYGLTAASQGEFEKRIAKAISERTRSIALKRTYQDERQDGGISAVVARFPEVSRYTYTTDRSGIITVAFDYR